jgi:hypothetical protein
VVILALESKVVLFSYDAEMERVCAASMRSCYSPHPSHDLFSYSNEKAGALEGERPFDDQRIHSLLRKTLELEHMDILEHGQLTRAETSRKRRLENLGSWIQNALSWWAVR